MCPHVDNRRARLVLDDLLIVMRTLEWWFGSSTCPSGVTGWTYKSFVINNSLSLKINKSFVLIVLEAAEKSHFYTTQSRINTAMSDNDLDGGLADRYCQTVLEHMMFQ